MVPMRCMQVLLGLARQVLWFSWQVATVALCFICAAIFRARTLSDHVSDLGQ